MNPRPEVLFDRPLAQRPRVSLILLDWSCRESLHILDYLASQDVPRDWFEVLWIEYYGLVAPGIAERIDKSKASGNTPPVDRWIVMNMSRSAYYHKHLMYNVGVIASRGEHVMIGDSDAIVTPSFVRTLVESFEVDPGIVLHLDEVRSHNKAFYPFNYPTVDEVLGEGCINWRDGKTFGVREEFDPLHERNYGACFCARRDDVVAIGGADEHINYLGHICGPYDLTWRLANFGRREVWHEREFLYHVWHPGSDGADNYLGPHDGRNVSTVALQTRRNGRVMPLVENPVIRRLRERPDLPIGDVADEIAAAVARDLTEWTIDERKHAISAGRAACTENRHGDAIALWEPLRALMEPDAQFLTDLGSAYYFAGRHYQARQALEEALRLEEGLEEDSPAAHRLLAWTLSAHGHFDAAVREFTSALACADPIDRMPLQETYRGRGWAQFHVKEWDAAAADFERALELTRPADLGSRQDIERGLGWTRLRAGSPSLAIHHFVKALAALGDRRGTESDDATAGLIASREAVSVAVSASQPPGVSAINDSRPQYAAPAQLRGLLRCDLADAYAAAGAHWKARQIFHDVLSIDAGHLRALCGRGWADLRLGRFKDANRAFKHVLRTPGADAVFLRDAFHGRAWIAYHEGRLADASKAFTHALRLSDRGRDAAVFRKVRRGLMRVQYLSGRKPITLVDLARAEGKSWLEMAVRMRARAGWNRLAGVLHVARMPLARLHRSS